MSCKERKDFNTRSRTGTEALKFRNALPKALAQLMPNPRGSGVLFLNCQHPKIQDILPFTYPEPPHIGQLHAPLHPGPSTGIRSSDTSPCKTRPTSWAVQPAQSTFDTYQWAPAPYSTLLRLLFQDGTAGRRCPSL